MPDISMCKGGECKNKGNCYRHTATPTEHRQSFFMIAPVKEDGSCEYFWRNNEDIPTEPFGGCVKQTTDENLKVLPNIADLLPVIEEAGD